MKRKVVLLITSNMIEVAEMLDGVTLSTVRELGEEILGLSDKEAKKLVKKMARETTIIAIEKKKDLYKLHEAKGYLLGLGIKSEIISEKTEHKSDAVAWYFTQSNIEEGLGQKYGAFVKDEENFPKSFIQVLKGVNKL